MKLPRRKPSNWVCCQIWGGDSWCGQAFGGNWQNMHANECDIKNDRVRKVVTLCDRTLSTRSSTTSISTYSSDAVIRDCSQGVWQHVSQHTATMLSVDIVRKEFDNIHDPSQHTAVILSLCLTCLPSLDGVEVVNEVESNKQQQLLLGPHDDLHTPSIALRCKCVLISGLASLIDVEVVKVCSSSLNMVFSVTNSNHLTQYWIVNRSIVSPTLNVKPTLFVNSCKILGGL